jgi:hypothetical protein
MRYLSGTVASLLSLLALGAQTAAAATITPTGAVTIEGTLNQSLIGGQLHTVCHVVFQGTADAGGFTLTSYTGSHLDDGVLACDDSITFPVRIDAVSPTSLNIERIVINTRLGDCQGNDVPLTWSNTTSSVTFPAGNSIDALCEFNGTLTVTPSTTIQ